MMTLPRVIIYILLPLFILRELLSGNIDGCEMNQELLSCAGSTSLLG